MNSPFEETELAPEEPVYDKTKARKFFATYGIKQATLMADEPTTVYLTGLAMRRNGLRFIRTLQELLSANVAHPELDAMGERKAPHATPGYVEHLVPLGKEIEKLRNADRSGYAERYDLLVAAITLSNFAQKRASVLYSKATRQKDQFTVNILADMWEQHTVMRAIRFAYSTWAAGEYMVLSKDVEGFTFEPATEADMKVSLFEGYTDV